MRETVGHTVRHPVVLPLRVTWHKRRLACENTGCGRRGFVEDTALAVRGGRVSLAALETMGRLVGDWLVPVSRAAAPLKAGWHTAHGAFVRVADTAGIVAGDPAPARWSEQVRACPSTRAIYSSTWGIPEYSGGWPAMPAARPSDH